MSLSLQIKNHILTFKSDRSALFITERKAQIIRRALNDRSIKFFDLTDDKGNYSETVRIIDVYGLKKTGVNDDDANGKRRWVCDHGKPQGMKQGCYTDPLGERQWSGQFCSCHGAPKPPQ